jgi:hypothetical protein
MSVVSCELEQHVQDGRQQQEEERWNYWMKLCRLMIYFRRLGW